MSVLHNQKKSRPKLLGKLNRRKVRLPRIEKLPKLPSKGFFLSILVEIAILTLWECSSEDSKWKSMFLQLSGTL